MGRWELTLDAEHGWKKIREHLGHGVGLVAQDLADELNKTVWAYDLEGASSPRVFYPKQR